jgi:transposase
MSYIKGRDHSQLTFIPECIDDLINPENPVRVIDSFVDSLSIHELGFTHATPAQTGRPAYDPKDLLKLYIYGYFNGIRSSRKLMRECTRNIELFYLMNYLKPDFRTISDFRKDNAQAIRKVFLEFVKLSIRMRLYQDELQAIDGSKFFAVNGRKRMYNDEVLRKKIERIDEHLKRYLDDMNEIDEREDNLSPADTQEKEYIKKKQALLKGRKETYHVMRRKLAESGETQILTTDPEARMMKVRDGFGCAYNVQTAVSEESHMISDYLVTNECNDTKLLHKFATQVKDTLNCDSLAVIADKGYDSKGEIEACVFSGIIPYVGFKDKNGESERIITLPYKKERITLKQKNSNDPDDIKRCLSSGVLPACYENSNITVAINEINNMGCFRRINDNSVECPMGHILRRTKFKREGAEFACRTACRSCQNRCKASNKHKSVYFGPDTEFVAVRMYGKTPPVNKPPEGFRPHNAFFMNYTEKTVTISIKDDIPKQKRRLCVSEHPFGTVKRYHGAYFLLCKGIKKTTAELGLSFLAYNLRRAINIKGAGQILMAINEG